jgi:hypothetical protein
MTNSTQSLVQALGRVLMCALFVIRSSPPVRTARRSILALPGSVCRAVPWQLRRPAPAGAD